MLRSKSVWGEKKARGEGKRERRKGARHSLVPPPEKRATPTGARDVSLVHPSSQLCFAFCTKYFAKLPSFIGALKVGLFHVLTLADIFIRGRRCAIGLGQRYEYNSGVVDGAFFSALRSARSSPLCRGK